MKPTLDFYSYLQNTFDFFNDRLFENQLSSVMFTITRKKNTCGFFRSEGWENAEGKRIHEVSVNPQYFITASPLEIYQTIAHEMCHQWQYEYGEPSRNGYHNKEWANKMRSIGLEPISVNNKGEPKPNFHGTGQKVSDATIPNGKFEKVCRDFFIAGYRLAVVDRQFSDSVTLKRLNDTLSEHTATTVPSTFDIDNEGSHSLDSEEFFADLTQAITEFYEVDAPVETETPTYVSKTTYQCPNCGYKVWGAANLPIGCQDCHTSLLTIKN